MISLPTLSKSNQSNSFKKNGGKLLIFFGLFNCAAFEFERSCGNKQFGKHTQNWLQLERNWTDQKQDLTHLSVFLDIFTNPKHVKLHVWTSGHYRLYGRCLDNDTLWRMISPPTLSKCDQSNSFKMHGGELLIFFGLFNCAAFEVERSRGSKQFDKHTQKWLQFERNWTDQKQDLAHLSVFFLYIHEPGDVWSCRCEFKVITTKCDVCLHGDSPANSIDDYPLLLLGHYTLAAREARTWYGMQECVIHRGIKTVDREPSWCRLNSDYHKALAPFFIPS